MQHVLLINNKNVYLCRTAYLRYFHVFFHEKLYLNLYVCVWLRLSKFIHKAPHNNTQHDETKYHVVIIGTLINKFTEIKTTSMIAHIYLHTNDLKIRAIV